LTTTTAALVIAVVCVVVLLTTGKAAGSEQAVLARLDSRGTHLVIVTDNSGRAGLATASADSVATLNGVEWALGLTSAKECANAAIPATGPGVAVRTAYGDLKSAVTLTSGRWPESGEGIASTSAAALLGLDRGVGGIRCGHDDFRGTAIVGTFDVDPTLANLGTAVLVSPLEAALPRAGSLTNEPLLYLYVQAVNTSMIDGLTDALPDVVTAEAADLLTVEAPSALLEIRSVIASDMKAGTRDLMVLTLGVGLILVAVTMVAGCATRRRDFGRLRALGATRSTILAMVEVQALFAGLLGVGLGMTVGLTALALSTTVPIPWSFAAGVGILALEAALVAAMVPAMIAGFSDPVRILRVP
jgi:putative ABC transport system permease protein